MTWVKLGDEFSGATEPLTDAAFRTHVEALAWSARYLLDLEVPIRHLSRFAYCDDPELAAKELVEAGWWEERGDAWFIGLKFPEWQREKADVERERTRALARQRRHRKHLAGEHDDCLSPACAQVRAQATGVESTESRRDSRRESRWPDPTRPVPEGTGRVGGERDPSRRDKPLRKPTVASAENALDHLSIVGRDGYRAEAIASLGDGLPDRWDHDDGNRWEFLIAGRMKKLMLEELLQQWERDKTDRRRTGT